MEQFIPNGNWMTDYNEADYPNIFGNADEEDDGYDKDPYPFE